ncbi:hypothetical protein [Anaerobium acetethylicum]|uniref:Uncharacterized protein n=1 Tax=Anaerobium acetethylicum TaxID=1619234 RepID=A0A1D3TWV2_9FIRM|nr:hypothetical protein [Anaerobium acetethylicum]SCP98776.1 hypothetical protein SAMN05421730_10269 [Anaerobium acetethylicum]
MLKVKIIVKNIEYDSIIKKIPDGRWYLSVFRKAIKKLPSKGEALVWFVSKFKERIIVKTNAYIAGNHVAIKILDMELRKGKGRRSDMLKFDFLLEEIDYENLVSQLLKKTLANMEEKDGKSGELARYVAGLEKVPYQMIEAAFGTLSQEQKNEMVTRIFDIYKDDLVSAINKIAAKNEIKAELASVNVTAL